MKIYHELIIFCYYLCLIFLTIILFSFIFNIITKRLFGNNPNKTKLYYLEIFLLWIIMAYLIFYSKMYFNEYNKSKITNFIKYNSENESYDDVHNQINNLEKFDIVVILGLVIIFICSQQHTFNEKLLLLNEDISILAETI